MKNYVLFLAFLLMYAISSAQVVINSYDSSHVSNSGIFGSSKEIKELLFRPLIPLS